MQHLRKLNAFPRVLALLLALIMVIPAGFTVNAAAGDWIDGTGYPTVDGLTIKTSKAYPMTYSDGVFRSTNQNKDDTKSGLKILSAETCILSFEAKASGEGSSTYWDYMYYGTDESGPTRVLGNPGSLDSKPWSNFSIIISPDSPVYIFFKKDGGSYDGDDTMLIQNIIQAKVRQRSPRV